MTRSALVLVLVGALWPGPWMSPAHAGDEDITLRVNDVDSAPGGRVTIEIRTYSPRPVGQGQICLTARSVAGAPRASATGSGSGPGVVAVDERVATLEGSAIAELLGGRVHSDADDASSRAWVEVVGGQPMLVIDFSSPSGTINASDGPMVELDVRLRDDLVDGEEFELAIDPANTRIIGPQGEPVEVRLESGRLRIRDDAGGGDDDAEGLLGFTQRTFTATESAGLATISVARLGGDDGAARATFQMVGGTATEGADYEPVTVTLNWPDGDDALRQVTVPLLADSEAEPVETVQLWLAGAHGASLDSSLSSAVLRILDSTEAAPGEERLTFVDPEPAAFESARAVTVSLRRAGDVRAPRRLTFATVDGSARAGDDYVESSAVLTWAAGEAGVKSFDVPLLDDVLEEGNETFEVRASGPAGEMLESTLTVLDDDHFGGDCVPSATVLCLRDGRFRVEARWSTSAELSGVVASGRGNASSLSESSGTFWFFSPDNVEVLVKVLDACTVSGLEGYWVFFSATTNVGYVVTVTDLQTGLRREYVNPVGRIAEPVTDTQTFRVCD